MLASYTCRLVFVTPWLSYWYNNRFYYYTTKKSNILFWSCFCIIESCSSFWKGQKLDAFCGKVDRFLGRFVTSEGTKTLILAFISKTGQSVELIRHRIFLFFLCQRDNKISHFIGLILDSYSTRDRAKQIWIYTLFHRYLAFPNNQLLCSETLICGTAFLDSTKMHGTSPAGWEWVHILGNSVYEARFIFLKCRSAYLFKANTQVNPNRTPGK